MVNKLSRKKININEDYVADSTLDIWCEEQKKTIQYELYKCFILKFILQSKEGNKCHYTMNGISFYNNHLEVTDDNIEKYFNNGILLDMHTSSSAVKYAVYEDGDWYLESSK